jgi:hypothetical protein
MGAFSLSMLEIEKLQPGGDIQENGGARVDSAIPAQA